MEKDIEDKIIAENQELKCWIKEIERKNDKLEKENKALRSALKEIL